MTNNKKKEKVLVKELCHLHTYFCGHATTSVNDIVLYALDHGYKRVIFAEHCPLKNNRKIFRPLVKQINLLQKQVNYWNEKLKGKMMVEFGLECEFPISHQKYFLDLLNSSICHFAILGVHFYYNMWKNYKFVVYDTTSKQDLDNYYEMALSAAQTKLFSWFAHPDIWLNSYKKWDQNAIDLTKKIIELSIKYDLPLGYNANGLHKERNGFNYPSSYFWKMVAKTKAKVIIESDAHNLKTCSTYWMNKAYLSAIKLGLKKNIVPAIKLRYLNN